MVKASSVMIRPAVRKCRRRRILPFGSPACDFCGASCTGPGGGLGRPFHRRDEPIAVSRDGFDEAGTFRGVSERVAQSLYGSVNAVLEIDKSIGRPQVPLKLVTCDHLPALGNQGNQDVKRLRLKLDSDTRLVQRRAITSRSKIPNRAICRGVFSVSMEPAPGKCSHRRQVI